MCIVYSIYKFLCACAYMILCIHRLTFTCMCTYFLCACAHAHTTLCRFFLTSEDVHIHVSVHMQKEETMHVHVCVRIRHVYTRIHSLICHASTMTDRLDMRKKEKEARTDSVTYAQTGVHRIKVQHTDAYRLFDSGGSAACCFPSQPKTQVRIPGPWIYEWSSILSGNTYGCVYMSVCCHTRTHMYEVLCDVLPNMVQACMPAIYVCTYEGVHVHVNI